MDSTVIWAGVVVFVALLIKGEYMARRRALEARYDNELSVLSNGLDGHDKDIINLEGQLDLALERLTKLERTVNDAAVAKTLGRR
jgi:hypothetical protein